MKWHTIIYVKALDEINDLPVDIWAKLTRILEIMEPIDSLKLIQACLTADLMQQEPTQRIGITQSVVVRFKSSRLHPSLKTLSQYAKAAETQFQSKHIFS